MQKAIKITHLVFIHAEELLYWSVRAEGRQTEEVITHIQSALCAITAATATKSLNEWHVEAQLCVCGGGVCAHVHSQSDLARGQRAGDPDEIQRFKGHQDEADVGRQVLGALGVHEVMRGVTASVFLVAHRRRQVYPGRWKERQEVCQITIFSFFSVISWIFTAEASLDEHSRPFFLFLSGTTCRGGSDAMLFLYTQRSLYAAVVPAQQ